MELGNGQIVEFTDGVSCRVISAEGHQGRRWYSVAKSTCGSVVTGAIDLLPGEIAVEVFDYDADRNVVVAAPLGIIVSIEIEYDPDTGHPSFKHYRNMSVKI